MIKSKRDHLTGRQDHRFFIAAVLILVVSMIMGAIPVAAQSTAFKAGDDVQVFFLNKWWPAKVVETNRRGDVLAEFEFAGRPKREPFKKVEVRFVFEENALAPARNWSDASGQFNIRAALMRIDEGTITLRKPDMKEVKVPIAKLSEPDQSYLKRLQKDLGPAAARPPELPPLETFDRTGATNVDFSFGKVATRRAIAPDPLPSYLTIKEGGAAFPTPNIFDRLGAVLPLGGSESWLLAAIESSQHGEELPTRLLWASLAKQQITAQQLLPAGEVVLDYHPPSHRLLTYAYSRTAGNTQTETLTMWETVPADKQVKPIARWYATTEGRGVHEPWGRLINGDLAIQRGKDHEYMAWDIPGKRMRYRLTQESFFAPQPTLSGGRKYLFVPEDKGIRIIDAVSGEVVSAMPNEDGAAGIAITDDGKRAAVLGRTTLTIWDLTDANSAPNRIQAEAIGSPFSSTLRWIDDQHLMAESGADQVLFSLKHQLALWSYRFDSDAVRETQGRRLREIVAGHLVFAATLRSGSERGLAVGAVKLPGPKVAEAAATLDPEKLMILKPGTPVRLVVQAGADGQRVQTALEREIAANKWKLEPSAAIVMTAEMKQGETQQVTYRALGAGFGGGEQAVTVTPFISAVRIEAGMKLAWQSATSSGVPPFLRLQEGVSVQGEVDKWQKPNPEFFDQLDIPPRILDPDKRNGLGRTQVSSRGLIPE